MKRVIILSLCLFAANAFACLGEAQLIGKVASVNKLENNECKVKVKDVTYFRLNQLCPLFITEINNEGITLSERACSDLDIDSPVEGVAVLSSNGDITLE